jgi:hypothetical protein
VRVRGLLSIVLLCGMATPFDVSLAATPQCIRLSSQVGTENSYAKFPLPGTSDSSEKRDDRTSYSSEDRDYLIRTIAFEAGDEPEEGKAAVGFVILNREKTIDGQNERVATLKSHGFPEALLNPLRGLRSGRDDFLDACAALWTAERIYLFTAIAPDPKLFRW